MSDERLNLIRQIENARGSRVLAYITSDRSGLREPIEYDDVRVIEKHLRSIFTKKIKKLDLFMYTEGGDAAATRRIVALIREFLGSEGEFSVLVPSKCMSAGTEISLGADNIIMGKAGHLGPVDTQTRIGRQFASVESLRAFFDLAETVGVRSKSARKDLFMSLTGHLSPIEIGRLHRVIQEGERGLFEMLESRRRPLSKAANQKIVDFMIKHVGLHSQPIYRTEAKNAGISFVMRAEDFSFEEELARLLSQYEDLMQFDVPFARDWNIFFDEDDFMFQPGGLSDRDVTGAYAMEQPVAVVESTDRLDVARVVYSQKFWRNAPAPDEIVVPEPKEDDEGEHELQYKSDRLVRDRSRPQMPQLSWQLARQGQVKSR